MAGLLLVLAGCVGPYYGNQGQYDKGNWRGWADNRQVNQRSRQQLALEKLRVQPVLTGTMTATGVVASAIAPAPGTTAAAGYKGIVANLSSYRRYSFRLQGTESKSFYLGPGERVADYLLPGRYTASIYYGGDQIGQPHVFDVGVQEKFFQGEKCHWYLVAEW